MQCDLCACSARCEAADSVFFHVHFIVQTPALLRAQQTQLLDTPRPFDWTTAELHDIGKRPCRSGKCVAERHDAMSDTSDM